MANEEQFDLERKINTLIGVDRKSIPNILKSLRSEKKFLEGRLSGPVSSEGGSDDWDVVKKEVEEMLDRLDVLQKRCKELQSEEGHCFSLQEVEAFSEKVNPYTSELQELWGLQTYLQWLTRIKRQSEKIQSVFPGSAESAVREYVSLVESCEDVAASECVHLKKYYSDMKLHWYDCIKDHLVSSLQSDLSAIGWPFISGALPTDGVWSAASKRMRTTILLMFNLDLDYHFSPLSTLSDPLPTAVRGLLESLEKRFVYHFYGEKPTNDRTKPEWILSQVLSWIRKHGPFIEEKIQPFLEGSNYASVGLKTEFIRGLIQVLQVKLREAILTSDRKVVQDESLMSHWIDELLQFELELRALDYPYPLPSCTDLLLADIPFSKWIVIEKKLAVERLSTVMGSPTAWNPLHESVESSDLSFVPQCAEKLMGVIAGIKDRYHILHSLPHHLDFLNLQIYLLLEFHCDLSSALHQAQGRPLSLELLAYLNASHYIVRVLQQWEEEPAVVTRKDILWSLLSKYVTFCGGGTDLVFFIELAYCHQWITGEAPGTQLDASLCTVDFDVKVFRDDFVKDPTLFHLSSTAFNVPIKAFQEIVNVIKETIAEHTVSTFSKKASQKWQKEKWHVMPSPKEYAIIGISDGAVEVMVCLRDCLHLLTGAVSPELRGDIWSKIVTGLDSVVLQEVVYSSHFSDGGAAQLRVDLVQNLVPLVAQYTDTPSDQILLKSKDACVLLNMLPGSIRLVLDLLSSVHGGTGEEYDTCVASLKDMSVNSLSPMEAYSVLKRRILT